MTAFCISDLAVSLMMTLLVTDVKLSVAAVIGYDTVTIWCDVQRALKNWRESWWENEPNA